MNHRSGRTILNRGLAVRSSLGDNVRAPSQQGFRLQVHLVTELKNRKEVAYRESRILWP